MMAQGSVAKQNMRVFDATLEPYVRQKLGYHLRKLERGERETWLDASGCVWCVFDDPAFERIDEARQEGASDAADDACDLQIYWSLGNVPMPAECDVTWVTQRILDEACRQLSELGYRWRLEEREAEGELHRGILIRRRGLLRRIGRR